VPLPLFLNVSLYVASLSSIPLLPSLFLSLSLSPDDINTSLLITTHTVHCTLSTVYCLQNAPYIPPEKEPEPVFVPTFKAPSRRNSAVPVSIVPPPVVVIPRVRSTNFKWPGFIVNLDDVEKKRKFQNSPGLYAVLFGTKIGETKESIISFAYADCSVFAVESGSITVRSQAHLGIIFEITVTVAKPFLETEETAEYEPLFLNIERFVFYDSNCIGCLF
jgi:hypothetical protein